MQRVVQYLRRRAQLHNPPKVHDGHAVGQCGCTAQVMRDEQHRNTVLCAQRGQQVQDLGADAHIQHRDRLVRQQQRGLQHQCACNHHALALPAGKFVRQARCKFLRRF